MRVIPLHAVAVVVALALAPGGARGAVSSQDPKTCPLMGTKDCPMGTQGEAGRAHSSHQADVNRHGDEVMGFDHEKTAHHFTLLPDGGEIRVQAKSRDDS